LISVRQRRRGGFGPRRAPRDPPAWPTAWSPSSRVSVDA